MMPSRRTLPSWTSRFFFVSGKDRLLRDRQSAVDKWGERARQLLEIFLVGKSDPEPRISPARPKIEIDDRLHQVTIQRRGEPVSGGGTILELPVVGLVTGIFKESPKISVKMHEPQPAESLMAVTYYALRRARVSLPSDDRLEVRQPSGKVATIRAA